MRRTVAVALALALAASSCRIGTPEPVAVESAAQQPATAAPIDEPPAATPQPAETSDPTATEPATPNPAPTPPPTEQADPARAGTPSDGGAIGASGLGDVYYSHLGNGGYDVASYDLTLRFDPETRAIDANIIIDLTPSELLDTFNLDLVGLTVGSVVVGGTPAAFVRDGGELIIDPPEPLAASTSTLVEIAYTGVPDEVPSVAFPGSGWQDYGSAIIVAGEPEGAAGWFPVNDHPLDKATYRFTIIVPEGLEAAANGLLVESTTTNGETSWVYESADPQASYLTTLLIGDLTLVDDGTVDNGAGDPVIIRHAYETTIATLAAATMERTGDMIEVFSEVFGPYPFEAYGTAVIDAPLGYALETQTLSVFGSDLLGTTPNIEAIVAHELAHQWFGDHVSVGEWSDIWLNEGFATYAQFLWLEEDRGFDIDAQLRQFAGSPGLNVPPGAPPVDDLFHNTIYVRGAITLHALRHVIGDESFFALVQEWVEMFGGGNVTTPDFIETAERVAGQDLGEFFDAWLFDQTMPELNF